MLQTNFTLAENQGNFQSAFNTTLIELHDHQKNTVSHFGRSLGDAVDTDANVIYGDPFAWEGMVLEFTDGTSATEEDLRQIHGQPLSTGWDDTSDPPMKLMRGTQHRAANPLTDLSVAFEGKCQWQIGV